MSSNMLFVFLLSFLCHAIFSVADQDVKLWAVLVAGSNSYYNYRHQADVCHAYQILHKHGIPDEQIIVMMYDDIANNELNPTSGIVINRPDGPDVYHDVPKDYVGDDVTPKNFLNVLLGNSEALKGRGSGRSLKSGPNDHVFINFADHGAPGLLAFPEGELYASDLIKTLETMYKKKQFAKLVFYVEACESGSMFDGLLKKNISSNNIKVQTYPDVTIELPFLLTKAHKMRHLIRIGEIFATTAANPDESSYACYYDEKRETYLGDLYSVKWMEDSDAEELSKETLQSQFRIVKKETNTSHVQEYGDLSIGKMMVAEFQGKKLTSEIKNTFKTNITDAVPSHEVPITILRRRLQKAQAENSPTKVKDIQKEIYKLENNRKYLLEKMKMLVKLSVGNAALIKTVWNQKASRIDYDCYENVVRYFSKNCFNLSKNDYSLRYLFVFVNMCDMGIKPKAMKKAMDLTCTHPPIYGIY